MSIAASVVNGQVTTPITETTKTGSTKTDGPSSSMDKDAFLQLLVTQMKYQDPLEPTSNTEYVSQFATFSELEEMQNLGASMDTQRASSLVGEYVTVKTTSEATGETSLVGGKVDYVAIENGKAYLSINGSKYSIDDLDSVVDKDYLGAYQLADDFTISMSKLPTIGNLTASYKDVIENLRKVYEDMSDYQKGFITPAQIKTLEEYEARIKELTASKDESAE